MNPYLPLYFFTELTKCITKQGITWIHHSWNVLPFFMSSLNQQTWHYLLINSKTIWLISCKFHRNSPIMHCGQQSLSKAPRTALFSSWQCHLGYKWYNTSIYNNASWTCTIWKHTLGAVPTTTHSPALFPFC